MRKNILLAFSLIAVGFLAAPIFVPTTKVHGQVQNIWYTPAQFAPSASTNFNAISGAVNIPTTTSLDLHICQLAVMGPTAGTSATLTLSDNQATPIKYFDAVTVLSASAGSWNNLISAPGPEGCVYFKGGIKINASAGSQFYFVAKGYY